MEDLRIKRNLDGIEEISNNYGGINTAEVLAQQDPYYLLP